MASTRKLTKSLTRSLTRKLTGAELEQLFLEKFKFTLGEELITNGTFDDGITGWGNSTGHFRYDSSSKRIEKFGGTGGQNSAFTQVIPIVAGRKYRVEFDVTHTSGNTLSNVYINTGAGFITIGALIGSGHVSAEFTAITTKNLLFQLFGISDFRGFWDNVSVKEITKQAPVAAFSLRKLGDVSPYAARIRRSYDNTEAQVFFDASDRVSESSVVRNTSQNLIPFSEDFSNSAWIKNASTITSSSETDPFGGTNAYKLTLNSSGDGARVSDTFSSSAGNYTFSVYVKKGTAPEIKIGFNDEGVRAVQLRFNFDTAQQTFLSNVISHSITSLENDWFRLSVTGAIDASGTDTFYIRGTAGSTSSGDTVHIFGAMLEEIVYESTPSGSELVTNGTFDTDGSTWGGNSSSGWYNITNPSFTSIVNGEAILDGSQGTSDARQHVDVTVGKFYQISVDMRTDSTSGSGSTRFYMSDGENYSYGFGSFNATNTMTTYSKIVQPTQSKIRLYAYNTKDDKAYYDNISVKEVAILSPSEYISTPVVSNDGLTFTETTIDDFVGGENLRKYSNEFNTASWGINNFNAAVNNNLANPVNGAVDSIKLGVYDTGGAARHEFYTRFNQANATQYTQSIYIKPFGLVTHLRGSEGGATSRGAAFDLINSQVITNGGMGNQGATIEDLGNGWRRVSFTYTSAYANSDNYIYWSVGDASSDTFGSSVHQDFNPGQGSGVYVWGSQVNLGTTAKAPTKTEAIIREGNASVVVLYNQTGGEDAIQSTTGHQPLLYKGGLLVKSGTSPAIDFADAHHLEIDSLIGISVLDSYYLTDSDDTRYSMPGSHAGSASGLFFRDGSSTSVLGSSDYGANRSIFVNGAALSPTTRDGLYEQSKGRSLVTHLNCATTHAGWGAFNIGIWGYGSSDNFEGKISEMTFFDSDQSANRTAIEKDIADFHNIRLSSSATFNIAANNDDGHSLSYYTTGTAVQFDGSIFKNESTIKAGAVYQTNTGGGPPALEFNVAYFRFANVTIDQGATIVSAKLKPIKKSLQGSASEDFEIAAIDQDSPNVPSGGGSLSTRTTAKVTLPKSTVSAVSNGNRFDTPDIKTVIQEIVNRSGWSSGNAIVIAVYTPTNVQNSNAVLATFGSKDGTDESAQLEITV